jgi:hypothetical protein
MRKSLVNAAVVGASALAIFAALPTSGMAVAHADADSFLTDMEAAGFDNGSGNGAEIRVGYRVCAEIAGGISALKAADDLWLNSHLDHQEAGQFVGIAIRDLCPQNA